MGSLPPYTNPLNTTFEATTSHVRLPLTCAIVPIVAGGQKSVSKPASIVSAAKTTAPLPHFFGFKKKRKHKQRHTPVFASPDEARAWIRAVNRASKKQKKPRRGAPKPEQPARPVFLAGIEVRHHPKRISAAPQNKLRPQFSPPSYSSLARSSLISRLYQIELIRPRRPPYEAPERAVAEGPVGTIAYSKRIIAEIRRHSQIAEKERNYIRLLAGVLDREASEAGPALLDALAFCRVKEKRPASSPTPEAASPAATVPEARRLPWSVLPAGEWDFSDIHSHFHRLSRERRVLRWGLRRLDFANRLKPLESWIGKDEFDGYVIFVFRWTKAALLDHPIMGNACYILHNRWRELSHLSKFELLRHHPRRVTRIVHRGDWKERVKQALRRDKP